MNTAFLREKWKNKDYVGLPQWFIDDMVDEEKREKEEELEKYRKWESKQYWPRSRWFEL